jgi:peptidoglycan/LPS O-acetylase OafA/YrhL
MGPVKLAEAFETRPNALNAVRLVLAAAVIVRHTFLFRQTAVPGPLHPLTTGLPVDGFFVISGFLIVRSWERRPDLREFARARAARILPGLWLCLVVTAFVIAPAMAGGLHVLDQVRYVVGNAFLLTTEHGIGESPDVPMSEWNPSLWTLFWEGCCYAAVALLGRVGRLQVRPVATFAFLAWVLLLAWWLSGQWTDVAGTNGTPVPRLGLAFALGALLWLLRDRVPFDGRLAAAAAVLLAGSFFTSCYQVLGAVPLAYLCLWVGVAAGRFRWLRWRNDLSYGVYVYGGPVQQSLVLAGTAGLAWWQFTAVAWALVAPLAAASWFLVERPVLRLTRDRRRRTTASRVAALGT